jgi:hypothetical protein
MLRILAALDPFYEQIAPSEKNSARRLRALSLLLRDSGMHIMGAVKLTTNRISKNKLFLHACKASVPVTTVLRDFVVRVLETIPRVAGGA